MFDCLCLAGNLAISNRLRKAIAKVAAKPLADALQHAAPIVAENAAWAFRNLAGGSEEVRSIVTAAGAAILLKALSQHEAATCRRAAHAALETLGVSSSPDPSRGGLSSPRDTARRDAGKRTISPIKKGD